MNKSYAHAPSTTQQVAVRPCGVASNDLPLLRLGCPDRPDYPP